MSETIRSPNAGPRMDRLPMSRWHYRLVALITAGLFIDAFELYSGGGVLAALVQTGWSTLALNATFVSVTLAGLVCGAWLAGVLGDRFGRRFCYQANLALFGFASIAGAFTGHGGGDRLPLLHGLGLGAEIVVGYGMLAEFLPWASRGKVMTDIAMVVNFSFFISLVAAYFVIPAFGWRAMFLIPGLATMGVWFARKSMPESPRWLESKGRPAEATALLKRIEHEVSAGRPKPPVAPGRRAGVVAGAVLAGRTANTLVGVPINVTVDFSLYGFLQ